VLSAVGGAIAPVRAQEVTTLRRLTPAQYQQTIADIFGANIRLGGRFEPDVRVDGLQALGTTRVSVSFSGLEQYDNMARFVASQVTDVDHRATLVPCVPRDATRPDDACARRFFAKVGRLLYRRTLSPEELASWVGVSAAAAKTSNDFYGGLSLGLSDMLVSLPFLFRQEVAISDRGNLGQFHLDGPSKATRLSFLLWNAPPDEELLRAAEAGEIDRGPGLTREIDRLMASPRLESAVRAFFTDMLGFSEVDTLAKDRATYPKFSGRVAAQSEEQTLRTLVDLLLVHDGDYRDIFTTRKTFLTPELAAIYRVALPRGAPNTSPAGWQPYEFPADDPRLGILTQVSFVALHSHPGRTSPTLRGRALREILLCQTVPNPPGNVDFKIVQDTHNAVLKTARLRLKAHATDALCAGCHKLTDPIGLTFETFDSDGEYRTTENGAAIDTSGTLAARTFANAGEFAAVMHDEPAATACLVKRLATYALGRAERPEDKEWLADLNRGFAAGGYRMTGLLRRIASSDVLYRAPPLPQWSTSQAAVGPRP
jgi:hypothetical protein